MANFPTVLDDFTPRTDNVDDVMAADVNGLQTAIESLEAKVGIDNSDVAGSLDYKVANKVDKVAGKGLSTNDYTTAEQSKLSGIEASADVTDAGNVGSSIHGASPKTTMADADKLAIIDTEASNVLKTLTWAYVKSILKTYFDGIYSAAVKATGAEIDTGTDDAKFATAKALADQTVLLKKTGGTMSGDITLGENTAVALDPELSADGKYTGITRTGTAGATLAFGDLVYLDPTDSKWELADANIAAGADGDPRGILGMCVLAANENAATNILLNGIIRADTAFPDLTINAPAYVSETAGDIVVTQPTTADVVIRVVGFALTANELYFNPSPDYIVHA